MSAVNPQWRWLAEAVLLAVHEEQLVEHGGPGGVRDAGMLSSAIARAQQRAAYGEPDVAELAACYGFGIARNHPFVDGNKRTAFVAVELFLVLNGFELQASDADCVMAMLDLASGQSDEAAFATWLSEHIAALPPR